MSTPETPTREFNKILGKIRALINKAEGTTNDVEADAYRAKADKMMMDYAVEEAELDASRPAEFRVKPERLTFTVCSADHPMAQYFMHLNTYLANHCRVEVVYWNADSKYGNLIAVCVGYSGDLKYLELLFTTLFIHMSGEIEPKPDPARSFDENVYRLHESGVKWERISYLMNRAYRATYVQAWRDAVRVGKNGDASTLVPWPDGARLKNAYRRWCKEIGEEPRAIVAPITYQRNFCEAYTGQIHNRLWKMRQANADSGAGSALVLRQESVKEMMDELFPPESLGKSKKQKATSYNWEAQAAGRRAGDRADLNTNSKVRSNDRKLS